MASLFISLIVKKYSLKAVKYQIAIQSILIGFVCLLSVLPVAINGTILNLSLKQALVFASMLSVAIGCVNAFVDLQSHETKLVYLVSGKRILSSMSILFVELCDVVLQSTLYFIVLHIWCRFRHFQFLFDWLHPILFNFLLFKLFFQKSNGEFSNFAAISYFVTTFHRKSSGTID